MAGHGHAPHEQAEHAEHHGASNKTIALIISVLALLLAISETLGKAAQTQTLASNIEAANLWAFFQGKTVRRTTVLVAAQEMETMMHHQTDPAVQKSMQGRIDRWRAEAARWESEPETNEGRKELMARAQASERKRDLAEARHHHYEVASAAFQIAIVLASATIITGMAALTWFSLGLGGVGLLFTAIGLFIPKAVHLF